jgi:hypothetical protein
MEGKYLAKSELERLRKRMDNKKMVFVKVYI